MSKGFKTFFILMGVALTGIIIWGAIRRRKEESYNKVTGKVVADNVPLMYFNGTGLIPMGSYLNAGDPITVHAEEYDMYKIDCDGIYINKDSVQLNPEFSNFIGSEGISKYNRTGL
uniref:Uncharacterized protein n=1 Tax=viral metagenome TaxID=1070528 RepID=A0A6M3J865_9ZZZZ